MDGRYLDDNRQGKGGGGEIQIEDARHLHNTEYLLNDYDFSYLLKQNAFNYDLNLFEYCKALVFGVTLSSFCWRPRQKQQNITKTCLYNFDPLNPTFI